MNVLHLAARLGYTRVVNTLLQWQSENPNILLDIEVDALSQDCEGLTPLHLSCVKGHHDTAILLCKWNSSALDMKNYRKQTPADIAFENG